VKHRLTPREIAQVCAALRSWGRQVEVGAGLYHPSDHTIVAGRFSKDCLPLTLDELETLIGRLDGTWTGRGLRTWDGWRHR
jgi:hypothetical protein